QRKKATFPLSREEHNNIKRKMLNWSKQFSIFLFLDSNNYISSYDRYECLLAADVIAHIEDDGAIPFHNMQQHIEEHPDWLFGHIAYDYKNKLEKNLTSRCDTKMGFPELYFFQPRIVCYIEKNNSALTIECVGAEPEEIYNDILLSGKTIDNRFPELTFTHTIDRHEYLHIIDSLRRHIAAGDCYEINFCSEGYTTQVGLDTLQVFSALSQLSP